jgi:hypothetical protein
MSTEETVHRGVRWQRDEVGRLRFYDADGQRWVTWAPGVDSPPLPPGWGRSRGLTSVPRPGWRTPWRLIPLVLIIIVLIIAVVQALRPAGNQVKKEAAAATALLNKCLAQDGTAAGHPKYSSKPVPCNSPAAAVQVVQVIPTTPGSPLCPAPTTGVILSYAGVRYPHILCVRPVRPGG